MSSQEKQRANKDGPKVPDRRAAIYVRVSSDEQAGADKDSLADQERRCRAYAEAQGYEIAGVYSDDFTGTKAVENRPSGAALVADAHAGEFTAVVILKHDRLARKATHNLAAFDLFESLGVTLLIVEGGIDTSTPAGRFFRTMMAAQAEMDRDQIVERLGSAKYRRAKSGLWGGGVVPYGYQLADDKKTIEINEDEMRAVRRMYELRLAGLAVDEVAETLRTEGFKTRPRGTKGSEKKTARRWRVANISRLIGQEVYKGGGLSYSVREFPLDKDSEPETFTHEAPAIVTPEEWEKANDRKGAQGDRFGGHSGQKSLNRYALKRRLWHRHPNGELVPMYASTRASGRKDGSKRREFLCRDARVRDGVPASCPGFGVVGIRNGEPMISTRVKAERVEALTLRYMLELVSDPERIRDLQKKNEERIAALDLDVVREEIEDRLTKLASRRAFLIEQAADDAEAGRLDKAAHKAALAELDEETDSLEEELARLDERDAEVEDVSTLLAKLLEGPVYGLPGSPPMATGDEGTRLSPEWFATLRDAATKTLTPGARGSTPELSEFAVMECKWLADKLAIAVVVSEDTGPEADATWPVVEVGLDASLKGGDIRLGANSRVFRKKCESHT